MGNLRSWPNAIGVAGLVLAAGGGFAQGAGPYQIPIWSISLALGALVLYVLRPQPKLLQELQRLRSETTVRDVAFLRAASLDATLPELLQKRADRFSPAGETWIPETTQQCKARALKLCELGLLEPRGGSEFGISETGIELLEYDDDLYSRHVSGNRH